MTEILAVARVQELVAQCPRLTPLIDSNDKTPFTDGFIDVYDSISKSNETWAGRIDVQVKGRKMSKKGKSKATFSIARASLEAYGTNGGALFFVVEINHSTHERVTNYVMLTPAYCARLLRDMAPGQKSKNVPLRRLPEDPHEIEAIIGVALKAKQARPEHGFDPVLLREGSTFNIYSVEALDLDQPLRLAPGEREFAIEVRTAAGLTVPLAGTLEILPAAYSDQPMHGAVSCGSVRYESPLVRLTSPNSAIVTLADGVTLILRMGGENPGLAVNLTMPANFAARLKATEFLAAVAAGETVTIRDQELSLDPSSAAADWGQDELWKVRDNLRNLQALFEVLDVDGALVEMPEVSDIDLRHLEELHRVLVNGEPTTLQFSEAARGLFHFGRWAVFIAVVENSAGDRWRYVDPFTPNAGHSWATMTESGDRVIVSAYDVLDPDEIGIVLNARLSNVVDAYRDVSAAEGVTGRANSFVIGLIAAADATPERKEELLDAANQLNNWVIEQDGSLPRHLLNRWQILWRQNKLTTEHEREIRRLKRTQAKLDDPDAIKAVAACALLLGDWVEAEEVLEELPDASRELFLSWPIARLREASSPEKPVSHTSHERPGRDH